MKLKLLLVVWCVGASLSGCDQAKDSGAHDPTQVELGPGRPEDRFGKGFGEKFRAEPFSDPAEIGENDMPPVSLTGEPVPID